MLPCRRIVLTLCGESRRLSAETAGQYTMRGYACLGSYARTGVVFHNGVLVSQYGNRALVRSCLAVLLMGEGKENSLLHSGHVVPNKVRMLAEYAMPGTDTTYRATCLRIGRC
eukprot:1127953-Rhodomonas_salina.1